MANTPSLFQSDTGFSRLPDVIDRLFRESVIPANRFDGFYYGKQYSNLLETNDTYIVQLALPGIDYKKLQIEVVGQQLTIKGTMFVPAVENATYLFHGLNDFEFSEVFTLPMEVTGEKAEATYDCGILSITLPKAEHAKPKMVKVNTVV